MLRIVPETKLSEALEERRGGGGGVLAMSRAGGEEVVRAGGANGLVVPGVSLDDVVALRAGRNAHSTFLDDPVDALLADEGGDVGVGPFLLGKNGGGLLVRVVGRLFLMIIIIKNKRIRRGRGGNGGRGGRGGGERGRRGRLDGRASRGKDEERATKGRQRRRQGPSPSPKTI